MLNVKFDFFEVMLAQSVALSGKIAHIDVAGVSQHRNNTASINKVITYTFAQK